MQPRIVTDIAVSTVKNAFTLSGNVTSMAGAAYLVSLFVAGFLTNFVPIISFGTGTLVMFSCALLLSLLSLLRLLGPLPKRMALAVSMVITATCLVGLKAAFDANPVSQRLQQLAIYFLGAWPFLFFLQVDDSKTRERFVRVLAAALFCLCLFGIVQGLLGNSLPEKFFLLHGDDPFGAGEDHWRSTGLTGNPIIFSSILIFASVLFFALWLERRRFRYLFALLCSLVTNYFTYTRASLFLLIPVLVLAWLLYHRFAFRKVVIAAIAVILILAASVFVVLNATNLLIVQRLIGSNQDSLESTLSHFLSIQNAWAAISAHPLAGVGIGSQGNAVGPGNAIITDGAWWILLLEFGVPLSIVLVILLAATLFPITKYALRKDSMPRALVIATISFHAYIVPASFINSGILGHVSFGLYWAVLGLSLSSALATTRNKQSERGQHKLQVDSALRQHLLDGAAGS
jgi:O-antigen ligase